MCFCSVLRPVNAFSLTNDSEYIPLSFPCSCLRHIQLGTGPIPNAPIKKNSPKNIIRRSSSASDNAKACLHGLPLAFLHIPLHSRAIKPTMQNNGKTTPAKVKIIVSARHCILSIKRRKITITAVTPKILKTFLRSRLRCSLATFRTSAIASAASSPAIRFAAILSDFISSRTLTSKASANGSMILISGNPSPVSLKYSWVFRSPVS